MQVKIFLKVGKKMEKFIDIVLDSIIKGSVEGRSQIFTKTQRIIFAITSTLFSLFLISVGILFSILMWNEGFFITAILLIVIVLLFITVIVKKIKKKLTKE